MGCVKPSYIKNFAKKLMSTYEGEFTTDFEQNKEKVTAYTNVQNKAIRNRIAGYITRILEQKASLRAEVESNV
ncbi:MAG: 30S ribosomal protein S17e [Methanothrix sp.]|uniref:30S ribosomal protein S17e n=1 Tax=Methanothrix sp. TaxID=90426 RepID=UPI0025E0C411|nr:30S ribosomal protein S17e [Methanothrix sp.]MCQ8903590.1 30S ribosomal protein S17e [Methanothrix sp.]